MSELTVSVLASGSKGNAIFITDGTTGLLFDAGLSGVELQRRLKAKGFSPDQISAIIVSHEHSDHVSGVGVLSRRYQLPVHISRETEKATFGKLGKLSATHHFECGSPFAVNRFSIYPFSISHDAEDAAGFTIRHNGTKIGIATDLGIATSMVKQNLKDCRLLIIEANHDPVMLAEGSYPWHLKQRIKSRSGHLSNFDTRDLLAELSHSGLSNVILAHLSEENNTPEKALNTIEPILEKKTTRLIVACQHNGSGNITI